jgi:hypothetical protein
MLLMELLGLKGCEESDAILEKIEDCGELEEIEEARLLEVRPLVMEISFPGICTMVWLTKLIRIPSNLEELTHLFRKYLFISNPLPLHEPTHFLRRHRPSMDFKFTLLVIMESPFKLFPKHNFYVGVLMPCLISRLKFAFILSFTVIVSLISRLVANDRIVNGTVSWFTGVLYFDP